MMSEEQKTRAVVNTLAKDKKKYQAELDRIRKEMERLNKEVQRILGKEMAKKDKIDYTVSGKFEQNKGNLPWPVKGVVTELFGTQTHPVYKNITLPANNGITIAAKKGSDAKCVFEGVVKQIMIMPGYTENTLPSIANWPKPPSRTARRSTPVTRWGRWRMQKTAPHSFISRYGRGTPSKTLHSGSDSAVCIPGNPAYSPTRNQIPEFIAAVRRPPQRISFHCSTIPEVKTLQPVICKADFADASLTQQGQDAPVSS